MQIRRAPGTVFLNPVASPSSATLRIYDPVRLFPGQWMGGGEGAKAYEIIEIVGSRSNEYGNE